MELPDVVQGKLRDLEWRATGVGYLASLGDAHFKLYPVEGGWHLNVSLWVAVDVECEEFDDAIAQRALDSLRNANVPSGL